MLFKPEFSITIVMYTVCTYKEDNMGNYTVPDEIRSLKPTGTIVKKIRDNYYVYSHSQHKDPESGKWKTDAGKLMGKIIPGVGYCPSVEESSKGKITCFDYGEYLLACSLSVEDYEKLKECFNPDEAMQIFSLSVIFCLETYIGLKAAEDCFQRCLISHDYPDLRFSYRRLSRLLELVGRQKKASMFQRLCNTDEVTSIAVDGHAIPADSEGNDLCSAGYKTRALKSEYMNLMVALDCATRMPVASRVFPGYMLDKKDFLDFMGDVGPIKGKVILVDMGFFSAENLDYISQGGAYYVIPVEKKYNDYKLASSPGKGGRLAQFLYHAGRKTDTVEYRVRFSGGSRVIYFRNISEAARLSCTYLQNMEEGKPGYTQQDYDKQKDSFGVIVLKTNHEGDAKEIYELYKSRWTIETFYDRLKNGIHFEELNLDDWALVQGVSFAMLIAGRIDARILRAAKEVKLTRKKLVHLMSALKLSDDGKKMTIHNIKKDHIDVCRALGIALDPSKKCLG